MSNNSDLAKAEKSVSAAEAAVGNAQAFVADLEVKRAAHTLEQEERENREARERFAASQRRNTV